MGIAWKFCSGDRFSDFVAFARVPGFHSLRVGAVGFVVATTVNGFLRIRFVFEIGVRLIFQKEISLVFQSA